MKERSGMPYDVVAFATDEKAMLLTNAQEGVFHRLMRHAWINGSLPCDESSLAAIAREPAEIFRQLWIAPLEDMWTTHHRLAGRLINPKQEAERSFVAARMKEQVVRERAQSARQSVKGKRGAAKRWAAQELKDSRGHDPAIATATESTVAAAIPKNGPLPRPVPPRPAPSQPILPNTEQDSSPVDSPPAEKRGGHHDVTAEHFQARCMELTGAPYEFQRADFVRLASLRKAFQIETTESPPSWPESVTNYFASPLSKWTIADLCARYAVFKNSALDEFNKPIALRKNANGGRETPEQREARQKETIRRWVARHGPAPAEQDVQAPRGLLPDG